MLNKSIAALLLLTGFVAGCGECQPVATRQCTGENEFTHHLADATAPADACRVVDDRSMMGQMSKQTDALVKAGKHTEMAKLVKQLARKSCTLTLPRPAAAKMTPAEIYTKRADSTLIVGGFYKCKHCPKWHVNPASGFAIGESICVTNFHVVNNPDKKTLIVMTRGGKVYPVVEVLAASEAADLAILRVDTGKDKLTPAPLAAVNPPIGTEVTCISHPKQRLFTLTHGLVSRYYRYAKKLKNSKKRVMTTMMTITADYAAGSSGGPIFGHHGNLVAVVSSTYSAYYSVVNGKKNDLQMVFKQTIPVSQIRALIQPAK